MTEPMVRGLVLVGFKKYLESHCDEEQRNTVEAALPPEVLRAVMDPVQNQWYPRTHFDELNKGVAKLFTSEEDTLEGLSSAGRCLAEVATGSFMKLLLKMLTPALFARKFPDFWRHDVKGGGIDVDASRIAEQHLEFHLKDVKGFTHIGPVSRGYIQFAMGQIMNTEVSATLRGWSLADPEPAEVSTVVTW